ncbi:MAG: endonuclease [Muribaculaceae bacterium]|nr:endonuclease [Muribaculaceae bacterium]
MKRFLLINAVILSAAAATAAIPNGYYNKLDGKTGAALKQAAYETVSPHTQVSSYSNLPRYFQTTDVHPESMIWWDMYSNVVRYAPNFSGLNREHSLPKSWWKVNNDVEYTPAYVDLFHLYPADGPANQAKSNYPLGEVNMASGTKFDNNVSIVGYPVSGQGGGAPYVYEPDEEYKGDFARTYFYMATAYQNLQWSTSGQWMLQRNAYPTLNPWAVALLLKWHRDDPVSQKETARNEAVYSFQNNRNPFIDFPDLAEYIWGTKVGEPFRVTEGTTPAGDPVLTAPVNGTTLDFGEVAVGQGSKSLLLIKGENLTAPLSIALSGTDKEMFSVADRTISQQLVNTSTGYELQVTYNPTSIGKHEARILIYDGGLPGTGIFVYFKGEALERPTLSTLSAYPAADITESTYTASWSTAPETVDFYVLSRTRYLSGGDVQTEQSETEETSMVIDGFDLSTQESYYVCSSRLGFLSTPSNVVFVYHSGLENIEVNSPLTVMSYPGLIRIVTDVDHTCVRLYDASGRVAAILDDIHAPGTELRLEPGVYLLTTAEHPTPVKLIAR